MPQWQVCFISPSALSGYLTGILFLVFLMLQCPSSRMFSFWAKPSSQGLILDPPTGGRASHGHRTCGKPCSVVQCPACPQLCHALLLHTALLCPRGPLLGVLLQPPCLTTAPLCFCGRDFGCHSAAAFQGMQWPLQSVVFCADL